MQSEASEEGWWRFLKLCGQMKTTKQLESLFRLFLTPEERNAISMRIQIIKELLDEKKTQRKMASDLNVSIAKITRGSNILKTLGENFKKFLKDKMH